MYGDRSRDVKLSPIMDGQIKLAGSIARRPGLRSYQVQPRFDGSRDVKSHWCSISGQAKEMRLYPCHIYNMNSRDQQRASELRCCS